MNDCVSAKLLQHVGNLSVTVCNVYLVKIDTRRIERERKREREREKEIGRFSLVDISFDSLLRTLGRTGYLFMDR